jgi:hypothetical protein
VAEGKILITGTGRAGTSLLVAVLTDLGLDTGFKQGVTIPSGRNAGLERRIRDADAPRIVKAPGVMFALDTVIAEGVQIDHILMPIRDLEVAAASRVRVAEYGRHQGVAGGLAGTAWPGSQERVLARAFYDFMREVAERDIACTMLAFPRFASDWEYTYRRLGFLAPDLPADAWKQAVESRYAPTLVHEQPLARHERVRVALGAPVTFAARWRRRRSG